MSTRVDKYQTIYDKQIKKYGNCLTIVMGEYDDKKAAFLLQNMFPITDQYLDHIHTKNNNPVPVHFSIHQAVKTNLKKIRILIAKGRKIVFPDIIRLEKLMMAELQDENISGNSQNNN